MPKKILVTSTDLMMIQFLVPHVINLVKKGNIVDIACSNVGNRIDDIREKLNDYVNKFHIVRLHRSPINLGNINGYCDMKRVIDSNDYDIIWTNEPVMGVVTRLAAKKARKNKTTVIYMVHGFHFFKGSPIKNWILFYPIEKFMSRYTDKLITINEEDYNLAKNKFDCEVHRIHGVGVNTKKFFVMSNEEKNLLRKELEISYSDKILLNVGELLPNKNQKTAILAMKKVVEKCPNAKLFIAGNGPLKDELQNLINENCLSNCVKMLGYCTEINKYMNLSDVLVACSFREGLPLNLMEAMLCGKYIIASKNRGHCELVKDGVNGYLVNVNDVDEYANKIIKVLKEDKDYSIIAKKCVEPYLDINVVNELSQIFKLE